jgi:hypothetical protein
LQNLVVIALVDVQVGQELYGPSLLMDTAIRTDRICGRNLDLEKDATLNPPRMLRDVCDFLYDVNLLLCFGYRGGIEFILQTNAGSSLLSS